ncbi:MAG: D-tyrosyl-tRNA(Tyr) deacylase [Spirochaetia bacterium]|nr:D-tyrosyl-tRNA(Tyr) deacylase [Spirochaetia bacterium]MCF7940493.1 D-tyrosyl-tRNA(Tyr) deacylase [Spirochaetia bacterium]
MKAVVQRVTRASVQVDEHICGEIGNGLVVYLGVHEDDTDQDASYIARKIAQLRIFTDEQGKMNRSVCDLSGGILLISQFTLCANTRKGNRPSFNEAMAPEKALRFYHAVEKILVSDYELTVSRGVFGAHMLIDYVNDGPVTIILDSST